MGVLGTSRAEVIPAHWIQQIITYVILEAINSTPTWEMNVAGAKVGRGWLLSDHAQEDACTREGRVPGRLCTLSYDD